MSVPEDHSHASVHAQEEEHGAKHHRKGHRRSIVHANLAESLKIRQVRRALIYLRAAYM